MNITKVSNGTAGNAPTVTFTVLKPPAPRFRFRAGFDLLTMAGPTTDYGNTIFGSNVTTPGYVTESAAGATCDSGGNCMYTFTHTVPASATGTFAIGVEARRTETVPSWSRSNRPNSIEYGAPNPVTYFSVDGSPVAPRRTVVR